MKSLALIFILFITLNSAPALADHPEGTVKVDIYGLVCDFCAQALEKVFGKEAAVDDIKVDLETKIVTIHLKNGMQLDDSLIEKNILDAGYNVEAIRRGG